MANDNLRSGPQGATAQASKLAPRIVQLVPLAGALDTSTVLNAGAETINPSKDRLVTKATSNSFAFCLPNYDTLCMGGEWIVTQVFIAFETACATGGGDADVSFDLGIYAHNTSTGALTAVDADGIVDGHSVLKARGVKGYLESVPLNGVGAGAESYTTAAPASNTVSMKIGPGVAQYTSADASVAGQDQVLVLTNTTSTGAGKYTVFAELKPVGGTAFMN